MSVVSRKLSYERLKQSYIYDGEYVRYPIPRRTGLFNGVAVKNIAFFEPTIQDVQYEDLLLDAIRDSIHRGDSVLIIGGGKGVSTVVAGRHAGHEGEVRTIEAAEEAAALCRETAVLNGCRDRVRVCHGFVGRRIQLRGHMGEASHIEPSELPNCDVLVIDCDGAEIDILRGMTITPEICIVEHHAVYDTETWEPIFEEQPTAVKHQLREMGHRIERVDDGPVTVFTSKKKR